MKLFTFRSDTGKKIEQYDSHNVIFSKIMKTDQPAFFGCMYIEPHGIVGRHEATLPQLFLVLDGEGWASGPDGRRAVIKKGDAVFWDAGEMHESGSETGMTAIILESPNLNPESFLKENHTPV
ncbi:cupin domain-containing protein [Peribacillus kribbensis]|uniref:cupin domain-containing protein n=1 Tax=Peribacillus kribbensis TaxID=356658 RepID=UPI0003F97AE7|nr:cupin domain-containing protein [Peribacillus kribbensis]